MHKIQDRYGRLQVLNIFTRKRAKSNKTDRVARCVCDCGLFKTIETSNLISGATQSCGCLGVERRTKHGLSGHPLYRVIRDMIRRCHNPSKEKDIKNYQSRGIKVCNEWRKDKLSFVKWGIKNGWRPGLTIERVDNNSGYEPSNCRFATYSEQNLNRRNNALVNFEGETKTITEWSIIKGLNFKTLQYRVKVGKFGKRIQ